MFNLYDFSLIYNKLILNTINYIKNATKTQIYINNKLLIQTFDQV